MKFTNLDDLKFNIVDTTPHLSKVQEIERDNLWDQQLNANPNIFNGTHFACLKYEDNAFHISRTDYKTYLWSRKYNSKIEGIRPIGVGSILYERLSDEFVFMQRTNKVTLYKGWIGLVGGTLDYDPDIKTPTEFINHVKSHAIVELREEVKTEKPISDKRLDFLAAYYDEDTNYLVFRYIYHDKALSTVNEENDAFLKVERNKVEEFVSTNKDKLFESIVTNYLDLVGYQIKEKYKSI